MFLFIGHCSYNFDSADSSRTFTPSFINIRIPLMRSAPCQHCNRKNDLATIVLNLVKYENYWNQVRAVWKKETAFPNIVFKLLEERRRILSLRTITTPQRKPDSCLKLVSSIAPRFVDTECHLSFPLSLENQLDEYSLAFQNKMRMPSGDEGV